VPTVPLNQNETVNKTIQPLRKPDTGSSGSIDPPSVFEVLRGRIIALDLAPGTVLNRAELQQEFGLSSTPIRDALMRLSAEGLLDIIPQSVTRVSLIDLVLARQAQFLRRSVELETVLTLAQLADRSFIAELEGFVEVQRAFADRSDITAFYESDGQFHRRMYELAGAPDLWDLVRQRSGHIDRIRRLELPVTGKMAQVVRAHGLIVAAVGAGDVGAAQARMREHLLSSLSLRQSLQDQHPTYFKV
jgi:GntR family transcriptional regulator, rspAB operon transcriptional repressor